MPSKTSAEATSLSSAAKRANLRNILVFGLDPGLNEAGLMACMFFPSFPWISRTIYTRFVRDVPVRGRKQDSSEYTWAQVAYRLSSQIRGGIRKVVQSVAKARANTPMPTPFFTLGVCEDFQAYGKRKQGSNVAKAISSLYGTFDAEIHANGFGETSVLLVPPKEKFTAQGVFLETGYSVFKQLERTQEALLQIHDREMTEHEKDARELAYAGIVRWLQGELDVL